MPLELRAVRRRTLNTKASTSPSTLRAALASTTGSAPPSKYVFDRHGIVAPIMMAKTMNGPTISR